MKTIKRFIAASARDGAVYKQILANKRMNQVEAARERRIRKDIKMKNLEKKLGMPTGTLRYPDGTLPDPDERLSTVHAKYKELYAGPPVRRHKAN